MDGSYLSHRGIIDASRDFVCVRLATYEDEAEGKFLASIFRGRSGELENSVFCILAPDGKTKLVRAGRSPHMTFRGAPEDSAQQMVEAMKRIAGKYKTNKGDRNLPVIKDLRLAINVAACDALPLAIAVGATNARAVTKLAWDKKYAGRLVWVTVKDAASLKAIQGVDRKASVVIVQPDAYGRSATLLTQSTDVAKSATALDAALKKHTSTPKGDHRRHVRTGRQQGVHWETEIPVTDPGNSPGGRRR